MRSRSKYKILRLDGQIVAISCTIYYPFGGNAWQFELIKHDEGESMGLEKAPTGQELFLEGLAKDGTKDRRKVGYKKQRDKLLAAMEWIKKDMMYKAPEQVFDMMYSRWIPRIEQAIADCGGGK